MRVLSCSLAPSPGIWIIDLCSIIIATAHSRSQAIGSSIVMLPNGWSQIVEAETMVIQGRSLILLDNNGTELQEITVPSYTGRAQ